MTEQEDLEDNPFYVALRREYAGLFQEAARRRHIVAVPSAASLAGLMLRKGVMQAHLLAPSPYFHGVYETATGQTVELENGALVPGDGFAPEERRPVAVLFEELHYNSAEQSFRVLCIREPLVHVSGRVEAASGAVGQSDAEALWARLQTCRLASDYVALFESFPENEPVLAHVRAATRRFNERYVIVQGFEHDVSSKLDAICDEAVQSLLWENKRLQALQGSRRKQRVHEGMHCFVMLCVHDKVYGYLRESRAAQDAQVAAMLRARSQALPSELGVDPKLVTPLPDAIASMQSLARRTCPLDKMVCLKETTDLITGAVSAHVKATEADDFILATDDLLPLIAYVLVQAAPEALLANLDYMEGFPAPGAATEELGFNVVSYRAAVQYLMEGHTADDCAAPVLRPVAVVPDVPVPDIETLAKAPGQHQPRLPRSRNNSAGASDSRASTPNKEIRDRLFSGAKPRTCVPLPVAPPSLIAESPTDHDLGDFLTSLKDSDDNMTAGSWKGGGILL